MALIIQFICYIQKKTLTFLKECSKITILKTIS